MGELEIVGGRGSRRVTLEGERISIGKSAANDIVLKGDPAVSRVHAVFEFFDAGWVVSDLGSRNGTFVNGDRIGGRQALHDGDELRLGRTRVRFSLRLDDADTSATEATEPAPPLTRRDRDVLIALCRPVLEGSMLSSPARVRDMAAALFISESAVKKAIGRLYDKFELYDTDRRLGRLATEAIRRGAVGQADVASSA